MSQVMQFRTPEQAKAYADSMDQHWRKTNAQYGSGAYTPPSISKNQYGQYSVGQQSPGRAQPRQSPYESSTAYQAWNPNIANNPSAPRPPAFQASYGNLDGTTSQQPNFQQRDAFISQINNQLGRMQQQSWQQPMGAPQFDFPGMASRANEMVQGGWQSPLAPTNPRQPSPIGSALPAPPAPAGDQVRRLLPDVTQLYDQAATLAASGEEGMPPSQPPRPGRLEPTPRPTKPRPPANPFPGMSVALPPGMNMSQFTRQLDGSYLPGGVTRRPSMTPRPPRTINWGEMTPDEIAATRSPYLGGRIPTVRNYGG